MSGPSLVSGHIYQVYQHDASRRGSKQPTQALTPGVVVWSAALYKVRPADNWCKSLVAYVGDTQGNGGATKDGGGVVHADPPGKRTNVLIERSGIAKVVGGGGGGSDGGDGDGVASVLSVPRVLQH